MILQVASAESPIVARGPTPTRVSAAPTAAEASADSTTSVPAVSNANQLRTDMQIDSQHQVYYEFVDDSTGNVVFEIPPEALREIGESLNVSLIGGSSVHSIDVKS
jgi:hypothetical protein